jgi:Fe-S-cluster containining protein
MKSLTVIRECVIGEYVEYSGAVDREFRREADMFGDRIRCGRGCSMCCSQMFSISWIEAAYISKAIKSMPVEERERLRAAARDYIDCAKRMGVSGDESETVQSVTPRAGVRLPCPALQGEVCSIYEARPIICRKWGIPVFNPGKPLELQACELNFRPGEAIEVDGIVEPQARLLEEWVELKQRARRDLERPISTATVAEALIHDYEEILFGESPGNRGDQPGQD